MKKENYTAELILGTVVLLLMSVPFWFFNTDFTILNHFYDAGAPYPWTLRSAYVWSLIYKFGSWPAMIMAIGALYVFLAGFWMPRLLPFRRKAIYLVLVMVVGPGILINAVLKDHYGRPRPRQVQEYGGTHDYYRVCQPAFGEKGKSFPCGHCSMGFFFFAFYFLYKRKNKIRAWSGILIAILYGLLIGIARVGQGGHFPSDVLWAGGLTFLTAAALARFIQPELGKDIRVAQPSLSIFGKFTLLTTAIIVTVLMILAVLVASPLEIEKKASFPAGLFSVLKLDLDQMDGIVAASATDSTVLNIRTEGFGFPGNKGMIKQFIYADTLSLNYTLVGFRTEFKNSMQLLLPNSMSRAELKIRDGHLLLQDTLKIAHLDIEFFRGSMRILSVASHAAQRIVIRPHGNKVVVANPQNWHVTGENIKYFRNRKWQKYIPDKTFSPTLILTGGVLEFSPAQPK